jgi:flagellar basal-body rod protein FlgB
MKSDNTNPTGSLFNRAMDVMGKSLGLRMARHSLVTTNMANMDTPGYRVRDLKFEKTMAEAVGRQEGVLPVAQTHRQHLPVQNIQDAYQAAQKNVKFGVYGQDENGKDVVDIDQEMTKLAKNHLMYNATVQMLAKEFEILKYAITEGGRS